MTACIRLFNLYPVIIICLDFLIYLICTLYDWLKSKFLIYHNNFGEQHGSYNLTLAQSKRQPSHEWNKSSLQLGAPNLAPSTTPSKHLVDFAKKAEIARTPVAQRQSGNNSFRSQFTLG